MYHEFFGLKEPAFSIAVNPRYLYMSAQHREALAHLVYGIQNGGFVMLTGEVGTGKTTIIRCLLEQLPANTDMAIILNPMASAPELLSTICDELGVGYAEGEQTIKALTDALNHFLLENHRQGRKTVLLIDEAQLLKVPVLEQIRLLTNLETTTEKLLQIILVGQPELKEMLARPELRQLSQRITARFHLEPLSLEATQAYIAHRLGVAGMNPGLAPFSVDTVRRIHQYSGGIPRLINVLCERLLLGAYAKNRYQVDSDVLRLALAEVSDANAAARLGSARPPHYYRWALGVLVLAILGVALSHKSSNPEAAAAQTNPSSAPTVQPLSPLAGSHLQLVGEGALPGRAEQAGILALGWREASVAQQALGRYLRLGTDTASAAAAAFNPCVGATASGVQCEQQHLSTWDELRAINRPGVLTLLTPEKKQVYVLMLGLGEEEVLLGHEGQETRVSWSQLSRLWKGDFLYAWTRPAHFPASLQQGDQGEAVTWLAEQFAALDKQAAPLARHFYTDKLKTRVELFQSSQQLLPTGVFDAASLRRLNEALGVDQVLRDLDVDGEQH